MENLKEVRNEMLRLHKTLLDIQRANYEEKNGKVTNVQLWSLLFDDENFTWLREISTFVSEVDELYASKMGFDQEIESQLNQRSHHLFDESDKFEEFKKKYQANLDTEAEVAFHHIKIMKLLAKEKA
jgi:hypothetical protein